MINTTIVLLCPLILQQGIIKWDLKKVGGEGYPHVPEDFTITEKAPTRAFSWLKAATTAFTFKTLLRHYAKWALTPWSVDVKLGP